jgi:hypothetical protein
MTSAGPTGGLYVSKDGGDTWKPITEHGMPKGPIGKVGCAWRPPTASASYALIEAEEGGPLPVG